MAHKRTFIKCPTKDPTKSQKLWNIFNHIFVSDNYRMLISSNITEWLTDYKLLQSSILNAFTAQWRFLLLFILLLLLLFLLLHLLLFILISPSWKTMYLGIHSMLVVTSNLLLILIIKKCYSIIRSLCTLPVCLTEAFGSMLPCTYCIISIKKIHNTQKFYCQV